MSWEKAYWNGLETNARKVTGEVKEWEQGDPIRAWWRQLCGQTVNAVEVCLEGVNHGGGFVFLYEGDAEVPGYPPLGIEGGRKTFDPWSKVTEGRGARIISHVNVPLVKETVKDREECVG